MSKPRLDKIKYKCLSDGIVTFNGQTGICGHNIIGNKSLCGAHGNIKCVNKVARNENTSKG